MKPQCSVTGSDVVMLSDDFMGIERKSCFRVTRSRPSDEDPSPGTLASRQQAEFFAALDGLGAARGPELVEGAGTMCLDGVFGNEELRGDLAIA
jgi:hypothetical protein